MVVVVAVVVAEVAVVVEVLATAALVAAGKAAVVGGRAGGRAAIFPTCDALSPATQSRATRVRSRRFLNGPFRSS